MPCGTVWLRSPGSAVGLVTFNTKGLLFPNDF